ncbi:SAM-dependent methyltransferase [Rhizobium leguminosarum bv. trifolii]|uniref:SAM-dependent methyltransferase n=1 Tax=Rhizobium leguminosarum bv. trifolii TaxID=386 RepID=A0A3E1BKP9_RHILT|nr:class I SAM-dependent methyltransferase [Rhizobium leguminosarum]RFB93224.1 SAM-dependent methyltransferase [Rhizobium leguminosarum bv. trifolii]RFB93771.1 SAM-dependent methyltransferase [Rhizobium leguminosarum bv. trifolii]
MTDAKREHWDAVYRTKAADSVSWYQPTPEPSLRALDALQLPVTASLIDVGGGASILVDRLVERGWSDLTVLDIAAPALDVAKARLRDEAARIAWMIEDVTMWRPGCQYDVWHDRAVFHFLTEPEQRLAYRRALEAGTAPGSVVIIATFAPDGPERCSGLPVERYDAAALAREFSAAFALQRDWREEHRTPGGGRQSFQWCVFRRR